MSFNSTPRRLLLLVVAALAAAVLLAASRATPANASAWDPHVILNGSISCPWTLLGDHVQWAWVSASDGESGWAWLGSETSNHSRPYSFTFWRAPTSTMTVKVTVGCSAIGQRATQFGVNRPAVGSYATRNIYWNY